MKIINRSRCEVLTRGGFTRTDLLVIVLILTLGGGVAVSAATKTRWGSRAVQCVAAKERLASAWSLFTMDNDGLLPGSIQGGLAQSPTSFSQYQPWAHGWLDWGTRTDNTNFSILTDPRYSSLAPYLGNERKVFKCPSDNFVSSSQREWGWVDRVRSVSGSIHVGQGNGGPGDGPWNNNYLKLRRLSELVNPFPTDTFIFLDEHPDSINDPGFFCPYGDGNSNTGWDLVDVPGNLHHGAATISYADGRAEIHAWQNPRLRSLRVTRIGLGQSDPSPDDARWLYLRTPRRAGY